MGEERFSLCLNWHAGFSIAFRRAWSTTNSSPRCSRLYLYFVVVVLRWASDDCLQSSLAFHVSDGFRMRWTGRVLRREGCGVLFMVRSEDRYALERVHRRGQSGF